MESQFGKTSYHGRIISEPSVTCSICEEYNASIGRNRYISSAELLSDEGWRRYPDTGWICPRCVEKRKAMRRQVIP